MKCVQTLVFLTLLSSCDQSDQVRSVKRDLGVWFESSSQDVFIRENKDGRQFAVSRRRLREEPDGRLSALISSGKEEGGFWLYPGNLRAESQEEAIKFMIKAISE
jgi:hypothetical protein